MPPTLHYRGYTPHRSLLLLLRPSPRNKRTSIILQNFAVAAVYTACMRSRPGHGPAVSGILMRAPPIHTRTTLADPPTPLPLRPRSPPTPRVIVTGYGVGRDINLTILVYQPPCDGFCHRPTTTHPLSSPNRPSRPLLFTTPPRPILPTRILYVHIYVYILCSLYLYCTRDTVRLAHQKYLNPFNIVLFTREPRIQ